MFWRCQIYTVAIPHRDRYNFLSREFQKVILREINLTLRYSFNKIVVGQTDTCELILI